STGGARATSSSADKTAAVNEDEDIQFVTYDIASGKRVDHGVLQLEDGLRPFFAESIAIGSKNIYTVAKTRNKGGHLRVDLLSFPNPVQ
ncbi:MAG TPA: hypothetical protein VGW37_18770, partial [Terriglobia bacterium]|nr:hypothetical protein [Terriglobia bacterium]